VVNARWDFCGGYICSSPKAFGTSATIDRCPNEKYTQSCKYYGFITLFLKRGQFRLINTRIFMRV
jgi:hypothetical protein